MTEDRDVMMELVTLIDDFATNADKFYNRGNSAAGTRARSKAQEIKKLLDWVRKDIQKEKEQRKEK